MNISELQKVAKNVRVNIIESVAAAKSGHPGGSLSVADILTVLYFDKMDIDPKKPKMEDRDRLVLSKGHVAPALYSVLAERGYFPKQELIKLRKVNCMLQGHPDMKSTPGIDMSTGSLGQGLSVANGMALTAKLNKKDYKIFAILGDGEVQEGQVWEAALAAPNFKLNNLIVFVDYNKMQLDGTLNDIVKMDPMDKKWEAFGWFTQTVNGHDLEEIHNAIEKGKKQDKPILIVLDTIKGKGVKAIEESGYKNHSMGLTDEQMKKAIEDLM